MWPRFNRILAVLMMGSCLVIGNGGCSTDGPQATQHNPLAASNPETAEFARLRERMVRDQLRARDIADPKVLAAMLKVPRHEFVPQDMVRAAYSDGALPLDLGQTISQPYIVAFMTQALELKGTERVLEIGTGSGYQAAVLAEIVPDVYTIEILQGLHDRAVAVLGRLGYRNIRFRVGDGYLGWPEHAPFDRIMITAAPEEVPQPLLDQLVEGGLLIAPIGRLDQELVIFEKGKSGIKRRSTIPVRFVPMTGKARE